MGILGGLARPGANTMLKPVEDIAQKAVKADKIKSVKLKIKMKDSAPAKP